MTGGTLCGDEEALGPVELLAEGIRPRAMEACVDCATLTGWDTPERLTALPEDVDLATDKCGPDAPCQCGAMMLSAALSSHTTVDGFRHARDECRAAPAAEKPKRNVPDKCLVVGCEEKGSSRNQWCCPAHAKKLSLKERQQLLNAWKRLRKSAPAVEAANG